jgi:uncharacterized membrane protein required for colicin V production
MQCLCAFLLLIGAVIACIGCSATDQYLGRVVDSRGRSVPHAVIVASHAESGSPQERFIVTSEADGHGSFTLDVPVELDYIDASTPDLKRHGELSRPPANITNTIVVR